MTFDQPLRFHPILMPRLWGGRRLAPRKGGPAIGEAWLLSDRAEAPSVVLAGPHRGRTLTELRRRHAPALFGAAFPTTAPFPLLIKLIDAHDILSVQVHPTDAYAKRHAPEPRGKEESWVILSSAPTGSIVRGLRRGVSRRELEQRLRNGRMEPILHRVPARPGDTFWIPPGTLHTIGSGVCLVEFQENSDVTYRLYDWNRRDRNGRARTLHVADGLKVLRPTPPGPDRVRPRRLPAPTGRRELLVNGLHFRLERRAWRGEIEGRTRGRAIVLFAPEAGVTLLNGATSLRLDRWETVLLPAGLGHFSLRSRRPGTILWAEAKPTR